MIGEIAGRIGNSIVLAFLVGLGAWGGFLMAKRAAWFARSVRSPNPPPLPVLMLHGSELSPLLSLGAGLIAGVVTLASPSAARWMLGIVPFALLALWFTAMPIALAEFAYKRWQRSKGPGKKTEMFPRASAILLRNREKRIPIPLAPCTLRSAASVTSMSSA